MRIIWRKQQKKPKPNSGGVEVVFQSLLKEFHGFELVLEVLDYGNLLQ